MRVITLAVLLVAGCATTSGDINGAKVSWQGASYDEVVSRWGPPNNHTTLSDGRQVYGWDSQAVAPRGRIYPSIGIFGGSGGVSIGTGIGVEPGGGEPVRCSRMLVFSEARVAEQMWQGDTEFCTSFGR
jgi:hypothetical protein